MLTFFRSKFIPCSVLFVIIPLFFLGCKQQAGESPSVLYTKPAITEKGTINAVIEIPAGTNKKIEYNVDTKSFDVDQKDGKDRIIDFLPYVGNYGFIPSTMMSKDKGGDGDALDVLVIGETQATGTLMEILPIAALNLIDGDELDTKIIAVPVDASLRVMDADGFDDLLTKYNGAMRIIETWFLNYKGLGQTRLQGWESEKYALDEIKKWLVRETPAN